MKNKHLIGVDRRPSAAECSSAACYSLRQDIPDDTPVDVGQAVMPALKLIRQPFVIDPQAVQHSRVQIVHMDRILHDVVAEVVG